MIGGTTTWAGPLIGAVLVASLQQWATVSFSSEASLLIVGLLLVGFVIIAPAGITGLVTKYLLHKRIAEMIGRRRVRADAP
jgi:branched-chain amino acid transport system permease protein